MPFTDKIANNILDWAFSKGALSSLSNVYIGLCTNNPEETGGTISELAGAGYSRVLISKYNSDYPGLINNATARAITNGKQINWTKATADWERVNGFFLSTSPSLGETANILFYGALDLEPDVKAAGGLLVEAGAVALFDPEAFRIEFPVQDVALAEENEG